MKTKMTIAGLFILTFCLTIAALAPSNIINTIRQACVTETITEAEITRQPENTPPTDEWVLYTRNAGNGVFRTGPGTPPVGVGSFEMVTPTGADKATLFNFQHIGTPLDAINQMEYSTYRTAGTAQQVTAINIQVDVNGSAPGGFTTLVFEPVYNTNQGVVQDGIWQTWDAYAGGNAIWWSSNPIPGAPNRDTFVSWDTILAANPDAVIVGGYGLNQGSGNPALTVANDKLVIGYGTKCFTYNFDPYHVASTPEACKNGNWQRTRRANGSTFKNQGDCMQYVNTGK